MEVSHLFLVLHSGADVNHSICRMLTLFVASAALVGCIAPPNYRSPAGFSATYKKHLFAQPGQPMRELSIPVDPPLSSDPLPTKSGIQQTGHAEPVYPQLEEPLGLW